MGSSRMGYFSRVAAFQVLPALPEQALAQTFRQAVLSLLQQRECIAPEFAERVLAWRHNSDFAVTQPRESPSR
ncbi:MAG: hypothetical protein ACREWG_12005 [Gammaproteobacteria bacterium]